MTVPAPGGHAAVPASRILVEACDVISFRDDQNPDQRRVGTVRNVYIGTTSSGVFAFYDVDVSGAMVTITNAHEPAVAVPEDR